jgi:hypothetical protein
MALSNMVAENASQGRVKYEEFGFSKFDERGGDCLHSEIEFVVNVAPVTGNNWEKFNCLIEANLAWWEGIILMVDAYDLYGLLRVLHAKFREIQGIENNCKNNLLCWRRKIQIILDQRIVPIRADSPAVEVTDMQTWVVE